MKKLLVILFVSLYFLGNFFAGCNDIDACNYVSTDADALDCCYENCVTITVGGSAFNTEVSWTLFDSDNNEVLSGYAPHESTLCLEDDCYSLEMEDSYGDGWNGGTAVLTDAVGITLFSSTFSDGFGPVLAYWTLGEPPCSVLGCLNPFACNFDSTANLSDGSCEYITCAGCLDPSFCEYDSSATIENSSLCLSTVGCYDESSCLFDPLAECGDQTEVCIPHPNDVCETSLFLEDTSESLVVTNAQTCVDSEDVENNGVWISFTTPELPASVSISCDLGSFAPWDNEVVLFDACPSSGGVPIGFDNDSGEDFFFQLELSCSELMTNTTYFLLIDGNEGEIGSCEITIDIDDYICNVGCTNPEALNYDSTLTFDDGSCIIADCLDPITETFCYNEENYQSFIIVGNGEFLENVSVEFLAGSINYYPWANLTVYDGYNNTYPVIYTNYDGDSDLTGLTLESSLGALYFVVYSNGATSCSEGTEVEWLFDIYCGYMEEVGCSDPSACNYDPDIFYLSSFCEYSSCIECIGDFNFDGVVDDVDYEILLFFFGCDSGCMGDTDGDGDVDIQDLVNFNNFQDTPCE